MENLVNAPVFAPFLPMPAQLPDEVCVIPDKLPVYIDPRARIAGNGKIENLAEFGAVKNVFDFGRCLDCIRMLQENYGCGGESPCMTCVQLVRKIEDANR